MWTRFILKFKRPSFLLIFFFYEVGLVFVVLTSEVNVTNPNFGDSGAGVSKGICCTSLLIGLNPRDPCEGGRREPTP